MEIGDTICNAYDYTDCGKIKGFIYINTKNHNLYRNVPRISIILQDNKWSLQTYSKYYEYSRIVLLEKNILSIKILF